MSASVSRRRQTARARPPQARLSRIPAIWSALIVTAIWSIATGAYFAFRDDVTPMTEMQAAYDRRIADLSAQFDRTMSRQSTDQAQLRQQLDALLERQVTLEQQAAAPIHDQSITGSINWKAPETDATKVTPPVTEVSRGLAVSTPKPVTAHRRHALRARRAPPPRPPQKEADQAPPASAQADLSQRSFVPE